jgi:hypothetical protein
MPTQAVVIRNYNDLIDRDERQTVLVRYQALVEAIREYHDLAIKTDQTCFKIGDRLIELCGTIEKGGVFRLDRKALEVIHQKLIDDKIDTHKINWLKVLGDVALTFLKSERRKGVSWAVHQEAGSPAELTKIIAIHERSAVAIGNKKQNLSSGSRGTLRRYKEIRKNFPHAEPEAIPALAGAMANLRTARHLINETIKLVVPQAKNLQRLDAQSIRSLVGMCQDVKNSADRCAALIDKATNSTNKPNLFNVA